jgi:hypothetical protein
MSAVSWIELDRRQRRRMAGTTLATIGATWLSLIGIYYLIPFTERTSGGSVIRLVAGIIAFVGVLVWQLHRIRNAEIPGLRAIEALGGTIPLFLVVFAATYLSLSHVNADHFSEPLSHTGALYLTITVFSTVGFGDITPERDLARLLMSAQMLLDLVFIGAVVRLIASAARGGLGGPPVRTTSGSALDPIR